MTAEAFTQLSSRFLRDPALSPKVKVVGAVMASYANKDSIAWPGTPRLVAETGLSRNLVTSARSELVRGGYLQKIFERDRAGKILAVKYRVTRKILVRAAKPIYPGTR